MRVNRSSYDAGKNGQTRLILEVGDDDTRLQIDIVGLNAFLLRRVFTPGATIEIDADDSSVTFHRIEPEDFDERDADIHENDGQDLPDNPAEKVADKLRKHLRKA